MSLTTILRTAPEQLKGKLVKQIIAFAGDGKLLDGSAASVEFRDFLGNVSSTDLARYADECLAEKFDSNGLALQDIVNQFGRRLGFRVEDGRYGGSSSQVAFDGLWATSDGRQIVVEVKTSPTFGVQLDTVAGYRRALIRDGRINEEDSSILLVVGRAGTEDLEAQIRGSRHAWDIRLISVEALKRLVHLKEELDAPTTAKKIAEILIPYEYTRVDRIIDLVFSATEEVTSAAEELVLTDELEAVGSAEHEASANSALASKLSLDWDTTLIAPVKFNDACATRVSARLSTGLVKRSRTLFASPDGELGVICLVSKEHNTTAGRNFWYGFHRYQEETLENFSSSYVAFGCGSPRIVLLIPYEEFRHWLPGMNVTDRSGDFYRHVQIFIEGSRLVIRRRKGEEPVDVTRYRIEDLR
ncbi:MAG TPA: hypothetical protein VFH27_12950 [Longimicrobiaceae bacterium]|nr:hypothetical protein [Longimicrobiaceae bacterium]